MKNKCKLPSKSQQWVSVSITSIFDKAQQRSFNRIWRNSQRLEKCRSNILKIGYNQSDSKKNEIFVLIGVISREIISSCHKLLDPNCNVAFAGSQVSMCQPHHWTVTTMVTAVSKKMNRNSSIKTTTTTIIAKKTLESINGSISSASGFRLLIEANGGLGSIMYAGGSGSMGLEMCETMSSISKNSVYKQRIDAMFDDSR